MKSPAVPIGIYEAEIPAVRRSLIPRLGISFTDRIGFDFSRATHLELLRFSNRLRRLPAIKPNHFFLEGLLHLQDFQDK